LGQRFALSISREISPAAPSGRPSCVLFAGGRKPLVRRVPRLSWGSVTKLRLCDLQDKPFGRDERPQPTLRAD
jgi:hypothetical protein